MNNKIFSSKQEKQVADFLDMKVVTGSGARDCHPGDVVSPEWLLECKTHIGQTDVIFYADHWNKIREEGSSQMKYFGLVVDDGTQLINHTWVLIPAHAFTSPCNELEYPKSIHTNISFDHEYLSDLYTICSSLICDSSIPVFKIIGFGEDHNKVKYLMPISAFQSMLLGE